MPGAPPRPDQGSLPGTSDRCTLVRLDTANALRDAGEHLGEFPIRLVMSGGLATAAPSHQIDYLYINARELGYLPLPPEPPRGSTEETNKE